MVDAFWVYANPARRRLLIHRADCPACDGSRPFALKSGHVGPAGSWEPARSYGEAQRIAAAMSMRVPGLSAVSCVICGPDGRARPPAH